MKRRRPQKDFYQINVKPDFVSSKNIQQRGGFQIASYIQLFPHTYLYIKKKNQYFILYWILDWISSFLTVCFSFYISERNLPPGFPVINQNPDLKVIETGTKALLDCAASGNPTVNIYWVKDAMRLASNPRFSVVQGGKNRGEWDVQKKVMVSNFFRKPNQLQQFFWTVVLLLIIL